MQEAFLQVLDFVGNNGYFARTAKELAIMSELEKKHLIRKKPGTKRVFVLDSKGFNEEPITRTSFKDLLKKSFIDSRSTMQPFVAINDLRVSLANKGISKEIFNQYVTELYDNNELELEKSFTANEGIETGLNYKNKKFFSYIINIE